MALLTDAQIDAKIQPIINYYNQMELDIITEIAKKFDNYDKIEGSLDWYFKKLDELGGLKSATIKIINKYTKKTEPEIKKMLNEAGFYNLDMDALNTAYQEGILTVNPIELMESPSIAATIRDSYIEINETYRLIKTKALESAQQAYMDIVNKAYLDVSSGTYDYATAIRNAVQLMASKGIEGATYRRGNTFVRYSIEGTVRRDTLTAVHQLANRVIFNNCNDLGTDYVEVSKHLGARVSNTNPIANHYGWQGGVYKIHGSDETHRNLKEATGYPDDIQGLGGVNCRHRIFLFIVGFSKPNPVQYDEAENRKAYELSQHQRKLERDIRYLKKKYAAARAMGDSETESLLKAKMQNKFNEINEFCKANGLKRDYNRELIAEQI